MQVRRQVLYGEGIAKIAHTVRRGSGFQSLLAYKCKGADHAAGSRNQRTEQGASAGMAATILAAGS